MIVLDEYSNQIEQFLLKSIDKFFKENGASTSIGVYCCPWAGWISINFNTTTSLEQAGENCPDFDFVEYDLIDFPEWEEEYEADSRTVSISGKQHMPGSANEEFNELFFRFLEPIVQKIKQHRKEKILLQMLDSGFSKIY